MKVLIIASSIYDKDLFAKRRAITGLEIMVRDILDGVSTNIDCSMFATNLNSCGKVMGGIKLLPNNFVAFYKIARQRGISSFIHYYKKCRGLSCWERINLAKSAFLFEHYVSIIRPDIVNLHDLNDWNTFFVNNVGLDKVKVLLTDHLYIGNKDRTYGYGQLRKNEETIFAQVREEFFVSFVSNGMRERFLQDYPQFPPNHAYCVVNGTKTELRELSLVKKPKIYDQFTNKKFLLCIGGFTARKNQKAIIDAVKLMNENERNSLCIVFIGAGCNLKINFILKKEDVSDVIVNVETVNPTEMASYYYFCDGTITTSLNESFGLTIIEGFCYGKPAVLFDDIDSFNDIYDKDVCVPIREHSPEAVKDAILAIASRRWDPNYITSYVKKFDLSRVQKEYLELYESVFKS